MRTTAPTVPLAERIHTVRGHKIMLDADLAALYGVATKVLVQAVKRNLERFPADFMFHMTEQELKASRSQFVTLNEAGGRGHNIKYRPYAFTEQGVAMLSSVLMVFDATRELMAPPPAPKRRIGFVQGE